MICQAALPALGPKRSLGGGINDVGVARVDEDPADVLGLREPHVRPGLAAVEALVDAVAEADVTAADVLARPDPDRFRIGRIDGDAADGIRPLAIEDRRPGRAGVLGLPYAARADGDVPGVPPQGMDGDVADAAGHDGRSDAAEGEPREELRREPRRGRRFGRGLSFRLRARWGLGGSGQDGWQYDTKYDGGDGCFLHGGLLGPAWREPARDGLRLRSCAVSDYRKFGDTIPISELTNRKMVLSPRFDAGNHCGGAAYFPLSTSARSRRAPGLDFSVPAPYC